MPTSYTALAVVPVSPTEKRSAIWMDALASYTPAVRRTERGLSEIAINFPAVNIEQAMSTGWRLLIGTAGTLEPKSFRVLTTEDYDREIDRINLTPLPSLVSVTEAAGIIGVKRQRVQQLIDTGQLQAVRAGSTWALPRYAVEQVAAYRAAGMTVDG